MAEDEKKKKKLGMGRLGGRIKEIKRAKVSTNLEALFFSEPLDYLEEELHNNIDSLIEEPPPAGPAATTATATTATFDGTYIYRPLYNQYYILVNWPLGH